MSLCQCIYWYVKNAGRAVGFPWNAKVTVENVLLADLHFHSASALLQCTSCNWLEIFFISGFATSISTSQKILPIRWFNTSRPSSSNCGYGVCALIAQLPAHLQPWATLYIISPVASSPNAAFAHFSTAQFPCEPPWSVTQLQKKQSIFWPVSSPTASLHFHN